MINAFILLESSKLQTTHSHRKFKITKAGIAKEIIKDKILEKPINVWRHNPKIEYKLTIAISGIESMPHMELIGAKCDVNKH